MFKAVVLDCKMPTMDGFQCAKEIREMMKNGVLSLDFKIITDQW